MKVVWCQTDNAVVASYGGRPGPVEQPDLVANWRSTRFHVYKDGGRRHVRASRDVAESEQRATSRSARRCRRVSPPAVAATRSHRHLGRRSSLLL